MHLISRCRAVDTATRGGALALRDCGGIHIYIYIYVYMYMYVYI